MIPYTNIAVNATSKVVEGFAKDPKSALAKIGWITGASSAVVLANMMESPETYKAISTRDKVRNFNITFGDQYFVLDADGNKRYLYANIRMDQTAMPFNAAVVAGLENAEYGTVPDGVLKEAIGQVNPLTTMFPPMWQAYRAYTDNYDPLRDSPIYRGLNVKPEDEVRNVSRGQPTSKIAQMIGGVTGLSPMGLEAAGSKVANSNNIFIQAAGGGLRVMFGDELNPREQAASTGELMLQYVHKLSGVVKLTTPGTAQMKKLEETAQEFNSVYKQQIDQLETITFKAAQGQADDKDIEKYIASQPPEIQKQLVKHAQYQLNVDKVMKHFKASDGIPPKSWWSASAQLRGDARAHVFYNEWISASAEDRRRMLSVASALHEAGVGYLSEDFDREFRKQRQLLGTEQR
jgi:hypothetical protein